jgi:hypothetical protein
MPTPTPPGLSGLSAMLKVLGMAPKYLKDISNWYALKPSDEERAILVQYCKHLNERRVFFAPHHREAAGAYRASLDEVRRLTLDASSRVEHAGATAYLHAILDHVRDFLDRWGGPEPHDEELVRFCMELGGLRTSVRGYIALLGELEPKAKAPNLFKDDEDERRPRLRRG